jgi:hypothetical protein
MRDFTEGEDILETFRRGVASLIADEMEKLDFPSVLQVSTISQDNSFIAHIGGRGIVFKVETTAEGVLEDADVLRYTLQDGVDGRGWSEVEEYEPHRPRNTEDLPMEHILQSDAIWLMYGNSSLA